MKKNLLTRLKKTASTALAFTMLAAAVVGPLPASAAVKLQPVKKIRATSTSNSVTLSWKKVKGAKSYKVFQLKKGWSGWKKTSKVKYLKFRKNKNYKVKKAGKKFLYKKYGNVYKTIKKTKNPKSTVYGLQSNAVYKFKIQAVAGKKASKLSKVISVRTAALDNNSRNNNNSNNKNTNTGTNNNQKTKTNTQPANNAGKAATYFYMRNHSPSETQHYGTVTTGTKDANGVATMTVKFITDADSTWLKNNYNIALADVTPKGYKYIFSKLGCKSGFTSNIQYSTEGTKTILTINVTANPAVQAIKIYEKSGKNIGFLGSRYNTAYYLFPSEEISHNNYYPYMINLYKKLRQKVESKLWTSGMSTADKFQAVENYIWKTTHYSTDNSAKKEYNPELWDKWSVDGLFLGFGNNNYIMPALSTFQGQLTTCVAAYALEIIAKEDLGLQSIKKNTTGKEGVYVGVGADSSVPTNSGHCTFYYVDKSGVKHSYDVQGMSTDSLNHKCSQHHCQDYLVNLD